MNEHITDIEIFEFANGLIESPLTISRLEEHLSSCPECALRLQEERNFAEAIPEVINIQETIDVSEAINDHFASRKLLRLPDTRWMIYTILILSMFITAIHILSNVKVSILTSQELGYLQWLNIIFSAVVCILFVDVLTKYLKRRKAT